LSDDGQSGITIIGLVGSVFSPYYAAARRLGPVNPLDHCSMNIAIYGPQRGAWAFTERSEHTVRRSTSSLVIGPSSMRWEGGVLTVSFDERSSPLPGRVAGTVRIHPLALASEAFVLDAPGRHRWGPIAPLARAEVDIRHPRPMRWSGMDYLDSNAGDEPLEDGFTGWSWARASARGRTVVTYDAIRRDGTRRSIAHAFDAHGRAEPVGPFVERRVARTLWGMERPVRVDPGTTPGLLRTLEDTPFYARSEISGSFLGEHARGVHEALSLSRFTSRVVQFMLPYRMRRVTP
jgi:carotenoid 1,2-hydratase